MQGILANAKLQQKLPGLMRETLNSSISTFTCRKSVLPNRIGGRFGVEETNSPGRMLICRTLPDSGARTVCRKQGSHRGYQYHPWFLQHTLLLGQTAWGRFVSM
jgi:hypothetical protein